MPSRERNLNELYARGPDHDDARLWGRRAVHAAAAGADYPGGVDRAGRDPGKEGLVILNDRPVNAEKPAHLLDDPVTPVVRLFVRNNGIPSSMTDIDPVRWVLEINGDPSKAPISRGVPVHKAMEDESLIAWAMNGEDIPVLNGYPLRLVMAGWPGAGSSTPDAAESLSGWLNAARRQWANGGQ